METTTATCHTDGCASAGIPIPGLVIGWIDDATGETVYHVGRKLRRLRATYYGSRAADPDAGTTRTGT
jgi:hypothetical protein